MIKKPKFNEGDLIKWVDKCPPDYECWPHLEYIKKGDLFLVLSIKPTAISPTYIWAHYKVLDLTRNCTVLLDSDMVECKSWMKRVEKI